MPDLLDPAVEPFFGCRAHTRAHEELPAGEPCGNCGAVYDAGPDDPRRQPITIPTPPDIAEATGCVGVATGVHGGDDGRICGRCLCLSPLNRGRVAAGSRPRLRRKTKADALAERSLARPRLTSDEWAGLKTDTPAHLRPVLRAFRAREAAIEAGDMDTAEALAALLATAGTADPKAFARELRRIREAVHV